MNRISESATPAKSVNGYEPFNLTSDPQIPVLTHALNPVEVQRQFEANLCHLYQGKGKIELQSIDVMRHKPGRRCLIEYKLNLTSADGFVEEIVLLGKIRAKGLDLSSYHLAQTLWEQGFNSQSEDKISIPEPMGVIPALRMWLQRKVPGKNATELLTRSQGIDLAKKIAQVAHKLHQANIPTKRRHTIADELSILHARLGKVVQLYPHWQKRIERLLTACDHLREAIPAPKTKGIHRDFYPDQVLVSGDHLYLLDLDLYCRGDPAVDIGNFIGHLTEQSVRTFGNPDSLDPQENTLKESFVKLAGEETRSAIDSYTILTLVRHISLSTQFPERHPFTPALIDLCEQRFSYHFGF